MTNHCTPPHGTRIIDRTHTQDLVLFIGGCLDGSFVRVPKDRIEYQKPVISGSMGFDVHTYRRETLLTRLTGNNTREAYHIFVYTRMTLDEANRSGTMHEYLLQLEHQRDGKS